MIQAVASVWSPVLVLPKAAYFKIVEIPFRSLSPELDTRYLLLFLSSAVHIYVCTQILLHGLTER